MNELTKLKRPQAQQKRPQSARRVFKGVLFDVWQWKQELFDGSRTVFETLSRPDTVLVLPVLADGRILLAFEQQPGLPPVLNAIGGRVESGESPQMAAVRELNEESGYTASEWRLWDAWQPVKKLDWAVYLFVAHGLVGGKAKGDSGERIKLRRVSQSALISSRSRTVIDDYELMHKLLAARCNTREHERAASIFRRAARR